MANIAQYLQDILDAVYGEQVRGSIHDAIDIINQASEVCISAGTAVSTSSSSSSGFFEGSLYVNTDTFILWKCVGTNSWQSIGIIKGADGNGIDKIEKTGTAGLVDTYTITFDDETTTTFNITNGKDGEDGENGSKWYKGTALNGTGTGITGFPGNKDDFYLNSQTGMVYSCTQSGSASAPDVALWSYVMTLTGGGGSAITVVDDLNSQSADDALSANQGHVLDTKKIDKPSNPNTNDTLVWDGSDWVAQPPSGGGHTMNPTPSSSLTEDDVVNAVTTAIANDGGENDEVPSLFGIASWSNTMSKTFLVKGIAGGSTPISQTGIGTWPADIDNPTALEKANWIPVAELYNIGAVGKENIEVKILYDPAKSGTVALGGWIIDDNETMQDPEYPSDPTKTITCGKMCIKFANEISEPDTHTAVVGVKIIINRTETVDVSF